MVTRFSKGFIMENDRSLKNVFGFSELHRAVICNDKYAIQRLVSDGFDNAVTDSVDFTAEELAIILRKDWLLPYLQGKTAICDENRQRISTDYLEKNNSLNKTELCKDEINLSKECYDIEGARISPRKIEANASHVDRNETFSEKLRNRCAQSTPQKSLAIALDKKESSYPCNSCKKYCKRMNSSETELSENSLEIYDASDSGFSTLKSVAGDGETRRDDCDFYQEKERISKANMFPDDLKRLTKSSFDKAYHSNNYQHWFKNSTLSQDREQIVTTKDAFSYKRSLDSIYCKETSKTQSVVVKNKDKQLNRSLSLPSLRSNLSKKTMDEQNEDWEVWDFGQTLDQPNNEIASNDTPEMGYDEKEESWANNSTKSSFTSSYRMDASGDSEEKNIYVYATKVRSLSESCDERVKSVNLTSNNDSKELLNVSSEEPRGFTRSLSITPHEKKKSRSFLALPFLKKSSSGNSLNISPEKNNSFTDFKTSSNRKSSASSPKLTKKSSSFTSLFRRKKSTDENPANSKTTKVESKITEEKNNSEKVLTITVPSINVSPSKNEEKNDRSSHRESGYASNDDVSPTKTKQYSITFTPEKMNDENSSPSTPYKDSKSPVVQKALLPLVMGVGLGGKAVSSNEIKNRLEPHSVPETGVFTLDQKTDNDYIDINFVSDAVKESADKITTNNSDVIASHNNFVNDTPSNKKTEITRGDDTSDGKERNIDMADFQIVLDTNYDYPKFSTPTKEIKKSDDIPQSEISAVEEDVALDDSENPSFNIDNNANVEFGMKLGKSNGQLPKYDELYKDENSDSNNLSEDKLTPLTNAPQNRHRFCSTSNCDDGDCGDSIMSFEQHEQEYVMLSQNGLLSPQKLSTDDSVNPESEECSPDDDSADHEDYEDEDYEDDVIMTSRHGHEERRMTMELLNYMPPILEQSTELTSEDLSTLEENRPVSQGSEDVCPLRLSTENLRLHDEELQKKISGDNILQDFVNVVLVDESENKMDEQQNKSRGLISQASSRRIQRQLHFEDPESCNSLIVNRSESSGEEVSNNAPESSVADGEAGEVNENKSSNAVENSFTGDLVNKSFEIPVEISTHALHHGTPSSPPVKSETNVKLSSDNLQQDETVDNVEERKQFQKKCLWYNYSLEGDEIDGNSLSQTSSNLASQDVDDVTSLINKSEDYIKHEHKVVDRAALQRDPSLAWDGLVLEYEDDQPVVENEKHLLDDIPEISDDFYKTDVDTIPLRNDEEKLKEDLSPPELEESNDVVNDFINQKTQPKFLRLTPTIDYGLSEDKNEISVNEKVVIESVDDELNDLRCEYLLKRNSKQIRIDSDSSINEEIKNKKEYIIINEEKNKDNKIQVSNTNINELIITDHPIETRKQKHVKKSKKVKEERVRPVKLSRNTINITDIFSQLNDGVKKKKKGKLSIRSVPAKTFAKSPENDESVNLKNDDVDTSVATLLYNNNRGVKLRPQSTEDYTVISFDDGGSHGIDSTLENKPFQSKQDEPLSEKTEQNINNEITNIETDLDKQYSNEKITVFSSSPVDTNEETVQESPEEELTNLESTANIESDQRRDDISHPFHIDKNSSPTEEDRDSGLSEDFSDDVETVNHWLHEVDHKMYDPYLVACLFIELSEKQKEDPSKMALQMAQGVYKISTKKNTCNFEHVLSYLLYFLGYRISPPPSHSFDIPKFSISILLEFLNCFVNDSFILSEHLQILLESITRPNINMIEHHDIRVTLINTCFEKEMQLLLKQENTNNYLLKCFCRINDCYAYFDNKAIPQKVCEYLLPYITKDNDAKFSLSILEKLGFMKNSGGRGNICYELPGSLLVLREIFLNSNLTKTSRSLLKTYMEKQTSDFQFCQKERRQLVNICT